MTVTIPGVLYCIVLYCIVLYCFCCLFVCYLYPINNVICSLPWVAVVYCYWIHYLCWFLTPRHSQVFRISNKFYLEWTITFWFLYVFLDQYSSTSLVKFNGQKFNVMKWKNTLILKDIWNLLLSCLRYEGYLYNSTLYMNAVFWLVDKRGIFFYQFLICSDFPPLQGYLSLGIPYSMVFA